MGDQDTPYFDLKSNCVSFSSKFLLLQMNSCFVCKIRKILNKILDQVKLTLDSWSFYSKAEVR